MFARKNIKESPTVTTSATALHNNRNHIPEEAARALQLQDKDIENKTKKKAKRFFNFTYLFDLFQASP